MNIEMLERQADELRKMVIQTAWYGKEGHITSSLSMLDIVNALYFGDILRYDARDDEWIQRDRFILSKAHGALGLYVILAKAGFFPMNSLREYCHTGQPLGDLASYMVKGVENTGGSLGHGLAFAAGKALAGKINHTNYLTYVITGDGECQEGSIWEAAMFIGNMNLNNLIWIIDCNGLQATGKVEQIVGLKPLKDKLNAFGFEVSEIDGHDYRQIVPALKIDRDSLPMRPRAIIAYTEKGKGVPLFEGKEGWHGRTPTEDEYEIIFRQLGLVKEELE